MDNEQIDKYLSVMRADNIPEGSSGLWFIHKFPVPSPRICNRLDKEVLLPAGLFTYLRFLTEATLYDEQPGAVVMEDTPFELRTHLGFVMRAHGNVLVTGLGLGCVLRGLLANPNVDYVTCIENSKDVLKMVAPHMPTDRLTIIEADALQWTFKNKDHFDCAWHDLWTNPDKFEPHLNIWHQRLIMYCRKQVEQQGAWAYRRDMKTLLVKHGIQWIG